MGCRKGVNGQREVVWVPLDPDLVAGLRRLKLARIRAIAPEVLVTART